MRLCCFLQGVEVLQAQVMCSRGEGYLEIVRT